MDKIVVGSMVRSGSTWTFNAVRMLAECIYGRDNVIASDWKHFEPVEGVLCEIKKAHEPVPFYQLEDHKVVSTVRDIRDAFCSAVSAGLMEVASYPRRGLTPGILDGIELILVDPSYCWKPVSAMIIRYEDMMINKVGTIKALAKKLWPKNKLTDSTFNRIALQLEYLPALQSDYAPDRGYLFGRPHRQGIGIGGHVQFLPYEDALALTTRYAEWLKDFGYPEDVATIAQGFDHEQQGEISARAGANVV